MGIWRSLPSFASRKQTPSKKSGKSTAAAKAKRGLRLEQFEDRRLLAILVSIIPNEGDILSASDPPREVAPRELTFRFDQNINPATLGAIQITRAGANGVFGSPTPDADDVVYGGTGPNSQAFGFIGVNPAPNQNEVIVRFAETLPDDVYRITIDTTLRDTSGGAFNPVGGLTPVPLDFELALGAQVISVVPQPITRQTDGTLTQSTDTVEVYFSEALNELAAETVDLYQLINTGLNVETFDDTVETPSLADYDTPVINGKQVYRVTLTFPGPLNPAAYRLRVGDNMLTPFEPNLPDPEVLNAVSDANSTFSVLDNAAEDLGNIAATASKIITADISQQPYNLEFPGGNNEPGHRHIPFEVERHINDLSGSSGDLVDGIPKVTYAFPRQYNIIAANPPSSRFNAITDNQRNRAREIFELYSHYLGVQFIELPQPEQGGQSTFGTLNIVTGELGAIDPDAPTGAGGVFGIAGQGINDGRFYAIMDAAEQQFTWLNNEYGGAWFQTAMHEIGHLLGLGHSYDLPSLTIMGSAEDGAFGGGGEPVFPGDHDIVHGQHLFRPEGNDVDLYKFTLDVPGLFSAETLAERPGGSQLDTVITLYQEDAVGNRTMIARNDDYYGEDSYLELDLTAGVYYIAVTSTGNTNFDPTIVDSGLGGTTDGAYDLRLNFTSGPAATIVDADTAAGTVLDGDADGVPGGAYNFWFKVQETSTYTLFVDKAYDPATGGPSNGTITAPYTTISAALAQANLLNVNQPDPSGIGVVVRIVGDRGPDGNSTTTDLARSPYVIGRANGLPTGPALPDGATLELPKGVTLMIDAGAILKLRAANINAGSVAQGIDLSGGAIQVLGTPQQSVFLTSYANDSLGGDSNANGPPTGTLPSGDWGGLVFRNDSDNEAQGIFVNYVNHADISYGGGNVSVNSNQNVYTSIHMVEARPAVSFNFIHEGANAAISADPNSFEDSKFQSSAFTADYGRVGPDVHGNRLSNNSINGLFVRIRTGNVLSTLDRPARFDDTDIVHVITENLVLRGTPGGPLDTAPRLDARLAIDAGTIVKLQAARIEAQISTQLIAEGRGRNEVVFTSIRDDRYGGSGTFDTSNDLAISPGARPGDWGGLYFGPISHGSLDNVNIQYAGGRTSIEGGFDNFNAVEIQQADVRITNSLFANNANGLAAGNRVGRLGNAASTIFVRGAQPVIVNNVFRDNNFLLNNPLPPAPQQKFGDVISINANALVDRPQADPGRSTGTIDAFTQYGANHGPLVRLNRMQNNFTNAMAVRGGTLTTQTLWDDTDTVHVLRNEIVVPNFHTYGGLRLQSSPTESLVVKLVGIDAGFTANGTPLDIDDRIGGSVQVVGQPGGRPVILTSINDDTVGAGVNVRGLPQNDTNDNGSATFPVPGDWRSVRLERYGNDRNVAVVNELEPAVKGTGAGGVANELNGDPTTAQVLGSLAPDEKSGDDNRRLGFEVHGFVALDDRRDVDVYSFRAQANTEVWIDIDRTAYALDAVVELVNANGETLARSDNSTEEQAAGTLGAANVFPGVNARIMQRDQFHGLDLYTTNPRDPGFRVFLQGDPAAPPALYYVRVRSRGTNLDNVVSGESQGEYQLQIRVRELDEIPGSTVRYADMRFATNAVEVLGMPGHSPLLGETAERDETQPGVDNDTFTPGNGAAVQDLGNLLSSDRNTLSVSGNLVTPDDVDWYRFTIDYQLIQAIAGQNNAAKTWATIFDLDYADGISRPDTYLSVFDQFGNLVYMGRDSDVADDQPRPDVGGDFDNLAGGSFGKLDPFIGPAQLPEGNNRTFFVAVSSNAHLPQALNYLYQGTAANELVKLEPVTSVRRIAEDHIGLDGYISGRTQLGFADVTPVMTGPLLGINDSVSVGTNVRPFELSDVTLYVSTANQGTPGASGNRLWTVDPNRFNSVETNVGPLGTNNEPFKDITIRSDGQMFGYQSLSNPAGTAGALVLLDAGDAVTNTGAIGNDQIPDATINTANVDSMAWLRNGVQNYDLFYSVSDPPNPGQLQGQQQSFLFEGNPANGSVAVVAGQSFGERGLMLTGPNIISRIATDPTSALDDITDGMNFEVQDDVFGSLIFEFEVGTELTTIAITPGATGNVNQFDGIMLLDQDFDGIFGEVPDDDLDMDGVADFTQFAATFTLGGVVFEFDVDNMLVDASAQRVVITSTMTAAALATEIARAINASPLVPVGMPPIAFASRDRVTARDPNNNPLNYTTTSPVMERAGTLPGITGQVPIFFDAADTVADIALAIATAINDPRDISNNPLPFDVTAATTGTSVNVGLSTLTQSLFTNLRFLNQGPGGAITGMAFLNGQLFGVSSNGGFYQISTGPGTVDPDMGLVVNMTNLTQDLVWRAAPVGQGLRFQGLTLGPQNIDLDSNGVGDYATTLFAITRDGRITALDQGGGQLSVFDADRNGTTEEIISTGLNGATGLAFSVLDFNLWHPTTQRRNNPGHGIINPIDDSRSGNRLVSLNGRLGDQYEGGASYYYGLEDWTNTPALSNRYFDYNGVNSQFGILSRAAHEDLASNPNFLPDTYDLPGGAHGSLITNTFSLEGYNYSDKPTLYFNYYLETENAQDDGVTGQMRDSARVLVSTDGGVNWVEVATNNSLRLATTLNSNNELPEFDTANSIARRSGLRDPRQRVQELFDTTDGSNEWRQARIDLGEFVGSQDVRLRFDFSTAGDIETSELPFNGFIQGDQAGNFLEEERGQDNQFEGFYVDDIIVGFAERGELVTGAVADTGFFAVPQASSIVTQEQLTGPYQLEIRRGTETAFTLNPQFSSTLTQNNLEFDTNARHSESFNVQVFAEPPVEDILRIDDGTTVLDFELDADGNLDLTPDGVPNVAVPITGFETRAELAAIVRDAINSIPNFGVTASTTTAADSIVSPGLIFRGQQVQLFGAAFVSTPSLGSFQVVNNHAGNALTRSRGDTNLHRDQGQIIIEANTISDTLNVGILVDNALRDAGGNPHPGAVRNLLNLNEERLVPGLLVENNLVINSGQAGIRASGQATAPDLPLAAVPFGRIINNTVFGNLARTGTGIEVTENASPTVLNNLVSNLNVGIALDLTSTTTVLGQNMYNLNNTNNVNFALDTGDIVTINTPGAPNAEPVFVNAATRNFYPAAIINPITGAVIDASQAIDSSINSLEERDELAAVTQPLGIPESPILAPELDLLGLERVDDPDVESPPGSGSEVFKDRGALDRADFDGPLAVLANPLDNVAPDTHSDVNRVVLPAGDTLFDFTIQFVDVNGAGIDNSTVNSSKFTLRRNGVTLVENTHYIFSYDTTNKLVRFLPVQGLWLPGSVFEITIVNNDSNPARLGIKDLAQNLLAPNDASGETKFTIVLPSTTPPVFSISTPTIVVPEGDAGGNAQAVFTVSLNGVGENDAEITFTTSDLTAQAGQDYMFAGGTLVFAPGVTSMQVAVDIIGDGADEDNEQFQFILSNPVNSDLLVGAEIGTATIIDDDDPSISIADVSIVEGDSGNVNLVFTVQLSIAPQLDVLVDWTTASPPPGQGSATAGVDYVAAIGTQTLTIPAGVMSGQIVVQVIGDTVFEPDEQLLVNLFNARNATLAPPDDQAVGTITDDDSTDRPTLSISSPAAKREGDVPSSFDFVLTLNRPSGFATTVNFNTVDGSAAAPGDFTAITGGSVIFQPGQTSKTVTVQFANDTVDETTETMFLSATAANLALVTNTGPVVGTATILDNDGPIVTAVATADLETAQPGMPVDLAQVVFEVRLTGTAGQLVSSPEPINVTYTTADLVDPSDPSRALAGVDYTAVNGTLTFAPGEMTKQVVVSILPDGDDEVDEQFRLVLSLDPLQPSRATLPQPEVLGTIIDDDGPTVNVTPPDPSTTVEGNVGSKNFLFKITMTSGSVQPVTVNFTTANGTGPNPALAGSDYQLTTGSVTFAPGEVEKTVPVPVFGDTSIEPNSPKEDFSFNISMPAASASRATIGTAQAVTTITDDDGPSISINDVVVVEGNNGVVNATFTVALSFIGLEQVTVEYTTQNYTAFSPSDYDAVSGTLIFEPGERIKFVTVPVRSDQFGEPTERFRVVLFNLSQNALATKLIGVGTITTDDPIPAPTQTVGLFEKTNSVFFLKETNAAGPGDWAVGYGPFPNDWTPLAGDWDGDGIDTFGLYDPARGLFLLKNSNTGGPADLLYQFGPGGLGWKPLVGDWNGDGVETVGLYRPDLDPAANVDTSRFFLRNVHAGGQADAHFQFLGAENSVPLAGDWNGDNIDTIGLYDPTTATFTLKNVNSAAPPNAGDIVFTFGPANAGWQPVTGDFDGNRVDTIGLFESINGAFFLRNSNSAGNADIVFTYGPAGLPLEQQWKPVFGNWDVPLNSALHVAADSALASPGAPALTQGKLDQTVDAALARWAVAGLTAGQRDRLSSIDVRVADLPDGYLGLTAGDVVYIDQDAAGRGWFVDPTAGLDEEFVPRDGRLRAIDASLADDRIDLLTVVAHELGHVLGLDDLDAASHDHDLMAETLATGVRRLPTGSILDDVFGSDDDWRNG